jgi:hypothetical protein
VRRRVNRQKRGFSQGYRKANKGMPEKIPVVEDEGKILTRSAESSLCQEVRSIPEVSAGSQEGMFESPPSVDFGLYLNDLMITRRTQDTIPGIQFQVLLQRYCPNGFPGLPGTGCRKPE